ncbi:ABC transporter ATP-binding protein [Amycolatopsis vastitatis]|uniref:Fatty acid ABC transporter ATP-binding/permease protein n=1 Tax=Amycolatopsis vastitatis TaxID=1905142 RepID=A0A229TFY1_9PSEU|nr:ABC transporter ATP-binding protein [Amycolatopsis vastitatis]OXM69930.1 multidrug ABC transporter ATP-binding protein [Amycolatopsis vastitatis]
MSTTESPKAAVTDAGERPVAQRNRNTGAAAGGPAARFMAGGAPPEKALDFKGSLKRLLRMLAPQRLYLIGVLVLGAVSVALTVIGPKILGQATDAILAGVLGKQVPPGVTKEQIVAGLRARGDGTLADIYGRVDLVPGVGIDFHKVGQILLIVLALFVVASFFGLIQARLTTTLVQHAVYRLREDVEAKFARLPLKYFDRQPRGEVLSRVTNDIDNLAMSLQQTLSQIVSSLLTVIGVLIMMFLISPLLAVFVLLTVPLSAVIAAKIGKRAQPNFIKQWSTTGKLNAHVEEMYTGHSLVKVFGRHEESAAIFDKQNTTLYEASFRAQFISGMIQPAMMFIGNLSYVLVAVIGALRVASGNLTLGEVQAFIQYSRQFSQPVTQIASMANLLQSGVASAERVFALLDAEEQAPEPADPQRPSVVRGRVEFQDVSFRYLPDKPLIDNLSLTVEPGQTVAIVGPTGAGKTTLVNLLMRFYELDSGRITLDGVDIAEMNREELRDQTGMVLQDAWLFGGTIAENIAYGADDPSREEIVEAAQATYVDRFVRTLPDGYETVLDDEGGTVSAGEKQLITVARAFLARPAVLILDEATSSVDTRTEVLIQRAMNSLRSGRTSFVIAHRLSTIRDADVILVMEHGRIVEQGEHETLLRSGGAYARLYAAQFAEAMAETD